MKKEKWLIGEIDRWRELELITDETATTLKGMYTPKKGVGFLTVLLSVVGCLLIGMGIVLLSANNWWYQLPVAARTVIGFMPLVISQGVVVYVLKKKQSSIAFCEGAALINMACVFTVVALVGQIFHLPSDFTNYLLKCGILSAPVMLMLDAVSPLIIFYWTAINGGIFYNEEIGTVIATIMFIVGAVYALKKCRRRGGVATYLSFITAFSGFLLILLSGSNNGCDISVALSAYILILLTAASCFSGCEGVFEVLGRLGFLIMTSVFTYSWVWNFRNDFESKVFLLLTAVLVLLGLALVVLNIKRKRYDLFAMAALLALILRVVWFGVRLEETPLVPIFAILFNIVLLVVSVWYLVMGAKKVNLYDANTGMIMLCTLIVMRFFDSELPIYARGIAFLTIGAGFLLFNLYLTKSKKRIKGDSV